MAHSCNKRPASVALDQDTPQPDDDDDALGFALSPQDLRRRLLNPPERLSSSLRGSIFPWGMPRELWEMVAAYLDKQDMDALALVSRDVREQVWLTTPGRRYAVPLGMVREAVARALRPSSAALVPARHSIEANACVADITALGDFLRLYSHVHRLTIRSPVNYPFTLPHLPNLHSLALVLSDIPLPFDKPLPVRGMCLELTRWRQPVSDIARLSMHTQLRTLKLFVNRIGGVSPAVLDLSPLRALSDLHELHVVSYQLNRPLLTLPFLGALTQLELHSVIVTPSELYAYSSLTSLRLSLLTMPGDADEVIATLLRKNTGLRSLAISWGGDVDDELPCHCMRSAPPTVERLALAPLVDFRSISHLTKLSYLDLRSCHSAFSVARFPDLTSLRTLVIDDRPPFRDRHLNVLASVQRVLIVAEGDDNGLAARVRTAAPQIQVLVNPPERLLEL